MAKKLEDNNGVVSVVGISAELWNDMDINYAKYGFEQLWKRIERFADGTPVAKDGTTVEMKLTITQRPPVTVEGYTSYASLEEEQRKNGGTSES